MKGLEIVEVAQMDPFIRKLPPKLVNAVGAFHGLCVISKKSSIASKAIAWSILPGSTNVVYPWNLQKHEMKCLDIVKVAQIDPFIRKLPPKLVNAVGAFLGLWVISKKRYRVKARCSVTIAPFGKRRISLKSAEAGDLVLRNSQNRSDEFFYPKTTTEFG